MSKSRLYFRSGIGVDPVNYDSLINTIDTAVSGKRKLTITYLNASCFNILFLDEDTKKLAENFDIIHPDGAGIFWAAKLIFGRKAIAHRFTGSDFYPQLWKSLIQNQRAIFFFGHDDNTLGRIRKNIPDLKIAGTQPGYHYEDNDVVEKINASGADVLAAGLGYPLQEKWVMKNLPKLNCSVIICMGEGIRVFAGSKKRGPRFMQELGLEWLARLALNPFKYFKRYVLGIPLFLYRIIIIKIRNLA